MKVLIVVTLALTLATAFNSNFSESEKVPSGRILNGQIAKRDQFPYIVGLSIKQTHSKSKPGQCSGCLISNKWILTAAHCLKDVAQVKVSLGATILSVPNKKITVDAKNIVIHKKYNAAAKINDIALIKIPPVNFNQLIRSIELPVEGKTDYSGKKVLIAGWGAASDNSFGGLLQWGRMEVLKNDKCAETSKGTDCFGIRTKAIDDITICYGDAGSPLVLESNPKVLIGLAYLSPKRGCDTGSVNAIFINVQPYLNWIKRITK